MYIYLGTNSKFDMASKKQTSSGRILNKLIFVQIGVILPQLLDNKLSQNSSVLISHFLN